MKLSEYAKSVGISYRTAFRWWKAGYLDAIQSPSKTILVDEKATLEKMKGLKNGKASHKK